MPKYFSHYMKEKEKRSGFFVFFILTIVSICYIHCKFAVITYTIRSLTYLCYSRFITLLIYIIFASVKQISLIYVYECVCMLYVCISVIQKKCNLHLTYFSSASDFFYSWCDVIFFFVFTFLFNLPRSMLKMNACEM